MTFNIKSLAIAADGTMPVKDATGEPQFHEGQPVSITFHSPGTKEYQRAKHASEQRNQARLMERMQGKSDGAQTVEEKLAERAEFLAAVTKSFNNFNAVPLELYADIELGHIADDADKFLSSRANFKKPSAKS